MRDSERRKLLELIRRVVKEEISDALSQHLKQYEHKEKSAGGA